MVKESKVVQVKFLRSCTGIVSEKLYSYRTDLELIPGDYAVVLVNGLPVTTQVEEVLGLSESALRAATKWIVQKVDLTAHLEREKQWALVQEIKNRLRQRKEEMSEILLFQQLAAGDPVIQELLSQLQALAPEMVPALPVPASGKKKREVKPKR